MFIYHDKLIQYISIYQTKCLQDRKSIICSNRQHYIQYDHRHNKHHGANDDYLAGRQNSLNAAFGSFEQLKAEVDRMLERFFSCHHSTSSSSLSITVITIMTIITLVLTLVCVSDTTTHLRMRVVWIGKTQHQISHNRSSHHHHIIITSYFSHLIT